MTRTAVIAGAGLLPAAIAAALADPFVAVLDGFVPEGLAADLTFRLERLVPALRAMADAGVSRVVLAGAVRRPAALDPALIDPGTALLLPRLMAAMGQGDDATLRAIVAVLEEEGFAVAGVAETAPGLIPGPGVLCGTPGPGDERDAARAAQIVASLGAADVGQGAVVQSGLCLAVEALPGTDHMLSVVAGLPSAFRPAARGGVLWKAPKPGQDRRFDLPALGPDTVRRAAAAGLAGIAWQAGGVLLLDRAAATREADAAGLFLWARA